MRRGHGALLAAAISATAATMGAGCGTKDGFAVSACSQSRVWKTGFDTGTVQNAPSYPGATLAADGFNVIYGVLQSKLSSSPDHGVSWTTLGSYTYPGASAASSIVPNFVDSRTMMVPTSAAVSSTTHYLVLKSADSGSSWQPVLDTTGTSVGNGGLTYLAQQPGGGPLFGFGAGTLSSASSSLLSKSTDGGATWASVDNFQITAGTITSGAKILFTRSGKVLAVHNGNSTTGVVRVSSDGGTTWSTTDTFKPSTGNSTQPVAAAITPQDTAIVGYGAPSQNNSQWIVRGSSDGGSTWSQLDNFSYSSSQSTTLIDVGADPFGGLWAVGVGQDSDNKFHFIIRSSSDQGKTWTTADDTKLLDTTNQGAALAKLAISAAGSVNVSLYQDDTTSSPKSYHSLIRYIDCF